MSASAIDAVLGPAIQMASPWSLFDQVWTTIMGYSADEFHFDQEKTPMSTFKETGAMIAFYYLTIFTGYQWMKNREPFKLSTLFKIHNFMLTAVSGALLVLFLEQLIPSIWNNGLYKCICSKPGWTDKLVVLYYLNYLTKYVELLDTVFLVLKKKPLTFLHTYHHGATAFLCWTQLVGKTPVSWVPITLNLTVHVVMYWYYFQSARGIRVGWKEWITRLQIIQFVLDLGFVYFATWDYYADEWGLDGLHLGRCEGELMAAVTGCLTLSSYLVLFISFYIATYRKPSNRGRKALGGKKDQAVTATGRAAETLKSARSRFGTATMDSVESSKSQWAVSRD
ncbi:elongation of fatty acids protein, putative [Talaromyces stipitatus ATCC 10500]|uniref:Elongation of fatty acids protein n=1 Tax=Talaromyces stipitatus (strain ATCC 10500 / CBS 375.48 / QM 6759 / NRRL 1006) TaxID=441959 RepID=B8M644_TALSN|nr:elongation of fatty acids protein, putative [Talaromyces stipitatus ATCC 10500]XP_002479479.1 elongation of fatty acids protein, putative [Talaromyces stipitatus ATCC 10500]EED19044.1 elongation of fatty acids protein, putative [Talaromyces stipitatus ATCC 10500]EED19045.1 elongation of fatty acids protein, putative [Talaromyces stipitatus ATCC 10500]